MFPNSSAAILRQFHGKNSNFCLAAAEVCFQSIRWTRKPRWIPMARSKIFRIPVRPVLPKGEVEELLRLNNNYRTQMKAIRIFLSNEYYMSNLSLTNTNSEESTEAEAADFERCMLENDAWNERVAVVRQNRIAEAIEKKQKSMLYIMEKAEKLKDMQTQKAKKAIKQLEEDSKTFITMDNIDEAIEHAMSNFVDYNYAIDQEGNIIAGRDTGPPVVNKSTQEQQT